MEYIDTLGQGGCGIVMHYRCRITYKEYALKFFKDNLNKIISTNKLKVLHLVSTNRFVTQLCGIFSWQDSFV